MNASHQRRPLHILSEIELELWARGLRRRWFARTSATLLQQLTQAFAQTKGGLLAVLLARARS